MRFVVRSVRCKAPVRPRRCTVSVSSSPSRMDAAAPGWSRSSDPASRSSAPRRATRRIEVPGIPQRLADIPVQPLGQMADHVPVLVHLTALHHAARAEDVRDGPAQPPVRHR